jgi:hypothetical protein
MRLKRVKVIYPGPSLSDKAIPLELVEGSAGVKRLDDLPDLRVLVQGEKTSFMIWPANVVWAEPALVPALTEGDDRIAQRQQGSTPPAHSPSQGEELATPEPPTFSSVAQLAEPSAVNRKDPSSNLSAGANKPAKRNKRNE